MLYTRIAFYHVNYYAIASNQMVGHPIKYGSIKCYVMVHRGTLKGHFLFCAVEPSNMKGERTVPEAVCVVRIQRLRSLANSICRQFYG